MKLEDKIKALPIPDQDAWALSMHGHLVAFATNEEKAAGINTGCVAPLVTLRKVVVMRNCAAELAATHDALMQQMAEALEKFVRDMNDEGLSAHIPIGLYPAERAAQAALRAYKEQQ